MNKRHEILGMLGIGLSGMLSSYIAVASCDQTMLEKLIAQGFNKQEILSLCGQNASPTPPVTDGTGDKPPVMKTDPAPLIGTWEGPYTMGQMTLIINTDGSYQLYLTMPTGQTITQIGTWAVEGPIFYMTIREAYPPGSPVGIKEAHPYTFNETKTVLTLKGNYGELRLTKR